ncbi:GTP-binding protein Era [Desulfosporosinus orientis DSM 765]|uniref:GTPase Era n=1 Tax=Desulfosporosinus orientis (strain ATCC 19365 / DSM 765 / NCIMB 8382 / VKM B-1628 / Singapore I) TaxID=768706 RepID=G7WJ75_DESOD|nr:GTPase Era [Desulfosporosinus orientis]AET70387.1 GTP-binding protein Era [Desulfosporosinus orientis DSM 765]
MLEDREVTSLLGSKKSREFRSGFVSVIGRPNAGKSTLLNHLLGQKVLIMSDKPQTTRNRIQCILTEERGQVIFLDTPGIHKPKHKLGEFMVGTAKESMREVDVILYVVDLSADFGPGEEYIIAMLKQTKTPCVLALNKVDLLNKEQLMRKVQQFSQMADFKAIVPISAKTGENTDELLNVIFNQLSSGPMYYPEDEVTDQPERFIMAELVREKVLQLTHDEIPHSIAVVIEEVQEKKTLVKVRALVVVERESQKGIIIGSGGKQLKEIGRLARQDIEALLGSPVFLELWVKVKKDWRNRLDSLRNYGYGKEKE